VASDPPSRPPLPVPPGREREAPLGPLEPTGRSPAGASAGGRGNPPRVPTPNDDLNIDVDLEPAFGAAALEVAELQAQVRRLQRRVAAFEAANAELSVATDPVVLAEIWSRVSTWGFEDANPDDGVQSFIAEADAHAAARERAEVALCNLLDRIAHLRRVPRRDCVIIPCSACSDGAPGREVVRHAALRDNER
jgi:hypothetical protein